MPCILICIVNSPAWLFRCMLSLGQTLFCLHWKDLHSLYQRKEWDLAFLLYLITQCQSFCTRTTPNYETLPFPGTDAKMEISSYLSTQMTWQPQTPIWKLRMVLGPFVHFPQSSKAVFIILNKFYNYVNIKMASVPTYSNMLNNCKDIVSQAKDHR